MLYSLVDMSSVYVVVVLPVGLLDWRESHTQAGRQAGRQVILLLLNVMDDDDGGWK